MIYSVNYQSKNKLAAGEVRCAYNQLGQIYDFMKEHPDKRYVITVKPDTDYQKLKQQVNYVRAVVNNNYTIECSDYYIMQLVRENLGDDISVFISYPVADWETFNNLISIGVSDIYIDGPLGFDMETISKKKGNVKIRVSPTISPNVALFPKRSECSFYIRPEDINSDFYTAIDVIDFHMDKQEQEDTLFNIYNDGVFMSDINKLIPGLRPGVSNISLSAMGDIAKVRSNCKQRCESDGNCHHCSLAFLLCENMQKVQKEQ